MVVLILAALGASAPESEALGKQVTVAIQSADCNVARDAESSVRADSSTASFWKRRRSHRVHSTSAWEVEMTAGI